MGPGRGPSASITSRWRLAISRQRSLLWQIFDVRLRGKSENAAFVDLGDQFIALMKGPVRAVPGHRHFGVVVDDCSLVRSWPRRPGETAGREFSRLSRSMGQSRRGGPIHRHPVHEGAIRAALDGARSEQQRQGASRTRRARRGARLDGGMSCHSTAPRFANHPPPRRSDTRVRTILAGWRPIDRCPHQNHRGALRARGQGTVATTRPTQRLRTRLARLSRSACGRLARRRGVAMTHASRATYPPVNTLKRVADNLWIVDGPIIRFGAPWLKMPFPTRMTVIRLASQ